MEQRERYNVYSKYLKNKYGEKVYKLPVNLPVSCPNRETASGCSFCSQVGTGFEAMSARLSVTEQLERTREKIEKKYKAHKFIAYFQNFTNTYLPFEKFQEYILEAAKSDYIVEISISTRPDCIHKEYLNFLSAIKDTYGKEITVELGLQTANYHTLEKIGRGHGLAEFIDAVLQIHSFGFDICVHLIPNLPYDTLADVIETAKIISVLPVSQVKLHSLYIAKGTRLAEEYLAGRITLCTKEEYYERLAAFLIHLPQNIVIERLFSRIPQEDSIFSNWGTSWWKCQEEFIDYMIEHDFYQGKETYIPGKPLLDAGFINQ